MSPIELGKRQRKSILPFKTVVLVAGVAALAAGAYWALPRFEWSRPRVEVTPDTDIMGLKPLEVRIQDHGRGIRHASAILISAGAEHTLFDERFEPAVPQKSFTLTLSSKLAGLKEGPATLKITARDGSLWNFLRGNETVVEKKITIDITPPALELIADDAYVNFGGVGVILYKTSTDAVSSGVQVGDYFFPGYKGQAPDPNAYLAFFAHPYNVAENEKASLVATDKAGNSRRMTLAYTLKGVRYKKSMIPISDEFIQSKVAPLLNDVGARQAEARDIFLRVNRDLRKQNNDAIRDIGRKTAGSMLWRGAFAQLSNSKVEANFADARTYTYQGENIDTAYHLGFDLSVTKRYPVEAANSGVVSFVGDLGIYGNTVVIDHGLGLATLYSHLSSIEVKAGDEIAQRQIIGRTGETGLAAGDHLHFGVYLHGVPVLPLEWWDAKWIHDNIEAKLAPDRANSSEETQSAGKISRRRRR